MRLPSLRFALLLLTWALSARAQSLTPPHLEWRTLETRWFTIHYEREDERWTLDMATRVDAVHDAVAALVGSAPRQRVTIIVADPNNLSNGFAIPLLGAPVIFFWPTPPAPTLGLGENSGWGTLLSVHEFAHIAHLTRPSRNPSFRRWMRLSPARVGPLALKSPRWVIEGYATYVEGRITGSGRPHSAGRAAVLRQWALEGVLPTYGELDGSDRFLGGSMAYLVGSAYLEWLTQRAGDSSLPHLWRRMSARIDRSFGDAFAGVYGAPPEVLYGRFVAELTAAALRVADSLRAQDAFDTRDSAGAHLAMMLAGPTGRPALSRDGEKLAAVVAPPNEPPRLVVWAAHPDTTDSAERRRLARAMARDPEDVPGLRWQPRPLKRLTELWPRGGEPFSEPRFLPDGVHLLVVHDEARRDGVLRRDLWEWDTRGGALRRITRHAGILHADPSPDGRSAVADRCVGGVCDAVRVDLATGAISVLAPGAPRVTYLAPRWSPDAQLIATAVHRDGHWRIVLIDPATGATTDVGPDDAADRTDPAWTSNGRALIVTSTAGGVPNLERIDLTDGTARPLTRVSGAAFSAETDEGGDVYFRRLHARGFDLMRLDVDSARLARLPAPITALPVTQHPSVPGVQLDSAPLAPARGYGLGPRHWRVLPGGVIAAEGKSIDLMMAGLDPVGRFTWMAQGAIGDRGTWQGGALDIAWRGSRPTLALEGFWSEDRPSHQHGGISAPLALDARYAGALITATALDDRVSSALEARAGASIGRLDRWSFDGDTRALAFASLDGGVLQTPAMWSFIESAGASISAGRTAGAGWTRAMARGSLSMGYVGVPFRVAADAIYGWLDRRSVPYELFALGGTEPSFMDPALASQRIAMPALPAGIAMGRQVAAARVSLPGPVWRPYFWLGSAGDEIRHFHRLVGSDVEFDTPGISFVSLPGVHVLAGYAYSLDPPHKNDMTLYLTLTYRP